MIILYLITRFRSKRALSISKEIIETEQKCDCEIPDEYITNEYVVCRNCGVVIGTIYTSIPKMISGDDFRHSDKTGSVIPFHYQKFNALLMTANSPFSRVAKRHHRISKAETQISGLVDIEEIRRFIPFSNDIKKEIIHFLIKENTKYVKRAIRNYRHFILSMVFMLLRRDGNPVSLRSIIKKSKMLCNTQMKRKTFRYYSEYLLTKYGKRTFMKKIEENRVKTTVKQDINGKKQTKLVSKGEHDKSKLIDMKGYINQIICTLVQDKEIINLIKSSDLSVNQYKIDLYHSTLKFQDALKFIKGRNTYDFMATLVYIGELTLKRQQERKKQILTQKRLSTALSICELTLRNTYQSIKCALNNESIK